MTQKNTELLEQKDETVARFEELKVLIAKDDVWREEKTLAQNRAAEEEAEKLREKDQMSDAARQIQRKWDWYQKVGRFMKKKKGKKGKKGKKKK